MSVTVGPEMAPWRPRLRDIVAALVFVVCWLIPLSIVAWRGQPPAAWPARMRDFYSVSCLFETRSERISLFYAQVRVAGEAGWRDMPETRLFRMEPFGHRNRFDRFMARFGCQDDDELARRELAEWLAERWAELEPESPPVVAVRFLWADKPVGGEHVPIGEWQKPERSDIRPLKQLGDLVVIDPGGAR